MDIGAITRYDMGIGLVLGFPRPDGRKMAQGLRHTTWHEQMNLTLHVTPIERDAYVFIVLRVNFKFVYFFQG